MSASKPYNGLFGLDRLPKWAKIALWMAVFLLTSGASIIATIVSLTTFRFSTSINGYVIYILAPALGIYCLAGASLRFVGVRWISIFAFWLVTSVLSIPVIFYIWLIMSFAPR